MTNEEAILIQSFCSRPNSYSISTIVDLLLSHGIRISEETCCRYLKEIGIDHNDWSNVYYYIDPKQDVDKLLAKVVINRLKGTF
jgi:arginine repressor